MDFIRNTRPPSVNICRVQSVETRRILRYLRFDGNQTARFGGRRDLANGDSYLRVIARSARTTRLCIYVRVYVYLRLFVPFSSAVSVYIYACKHVHMPRVIAPNVNAAFIRYLTEPAYRIITSPLHSSAFNWRVQKTQPHRDFSIERSYRYAEIPARRRDRHPDATRLISRIRWFVLNCTRISHRTRHDSKAIRGADRRRNSRPGIFYYVRSHMRGRGYGDVSTRCRKRGSQISRVTRVWPARRSEMGHATKRWDPLKGEPGSGLKIPSASRCSCAFRWDEYRPCLPCAFTRCWLFQKAWLARSHRHNCVPANPNYPLCH